MALSKKLPFGQPFKCFIGYKNYEKNRLLYKINFDENSRICFLIQKKKFFIIKYMETLEKIRNVIKTEFNSELIDSKKISKSLKKISKKMRLSMFICTCNID